MNDQLVESLCEVLARIARGPVLEVCAGGGELAAALGRAGVPVIATDASPPPAGANPVECLTAAEALRRHRPAVVIGSFVPVDAGVHEEILGDPGVSHYLLLTAVLPGGSGGRPYPQGLPGWTSGFLEDLARWMITRHDYHIDDRRPIVTHGEAWLYERVGAPAARRPGREIAPSAIRPAAVATGSCGSHS